MTAWRAAVTLSAAALLASCGADSPTAARAPRQNVSAASTLSVTISGPANVRLGQSCTWTAQVTGGTPPYQYDWNAPILSQSQSITTGFSTPGYKYFWVTVSDAGWQQAEAETYVLAGSTSGC